MKTRTFVFILILVLAVSVVFVVSCDNGGVIPPSSGTSDISTTLSGTWINPDYDGTMFQENGNPAKVICTHISGNDYTWDFYFFHDDEVPIDTITWTLTDQWTDSEGNVFTRWYRDIGDGEHAYGLAKIHADNETMEVMGSNVDYPAEIDPAGENYGIYSRPE